MTRLFIIHIVTAIQIAPLPPDKYRHNIYTIKVIADLFVMKNMYVYTINYVKLHPFTLKIRLVLIIFKQAHGI